MPKTAAAKHYGARIVLLSILYAVTLMAAIYAFKHQLLSGPIAVIVAALPALSIIGMFVAIGRYLVEEQDEYLRILLVRQMLWASGFALSAATLWGFLESFGIIGHIDSYYIAVVWFGGLGLGSCINRMTLGASVQC